MFESADRGFINLRIAQLAHANNVLCLSAFPGFQADIK